MVLLFAAPRGTCAPPQILDSSYFRDCARRVSLEATSAALPRGEFAPTTLTLSPVLYHPHSSSSPKLFPTVLLQRWVSPNLALAGGLGYGMTRQRITLLQNIGFRYLPAALAWGPFTPEIRFAKFRIEGLPEYTLKWQHLQWAYQASFGAWNVDAGISILSERIFPKESERNAPNVPGKLEVSTKCFTLTVGYDVFSWLRLSARMVAHPQFFTGGAQLSVAI